MNKYNDSKFWHGHSPWIFIGALSIFIPIFAFLTVENINRQKKNSVQLLVEKGAALIRSFEAGTRTGMMGMMGCVDGAVGGCGGKFRLQKLLMETSQQPDIVYLLVTNKDGIIVAHNNPDEIGKEYMGKLDADEVLILNTLKWRQISGSKGEKIFEVLRRFSPRPGRGRGPDHISMFKHQPPEWCEYMGCHELNDYEPHIIFVGLDMTSINEARNAETRQILITSLILLFIGMSGLILLFVLQYHRLNEIRALRDEIDKNKQLATIGMLASGVAHEIRNPLSSIKGFATYFKERYRDIPEDINIAEIMIQEVDRLNRVVNQLLEFARPVKIIKQLICINTLVEDSLKLVARQAIEKGIEIRTELLPDTEQILLDADKISQVLLNLYLNAIEAMTQGGMLSISVFKDKKGTVICISDNGCGIKPEDITHVFDPYFTTKSSGTGLGLAIVNNILESNDGKIHIESNIGKGTTVSVILP